VDRQSFVKSSLGTGGSALLASVAAANRLDASIGKSSQCHQDATARLGHFSKPETQEIE
jgi:hypothetical protein